MKGSVGSAAVLLLVGAASAPIAAHQPDHFARYLKENRVVAERIVKEAGLEPQ